MAEYNTLIRSQPGPVTLGAHLIILDGGTDWKHVRILLPHPALSHIRNIFTMQSCSPEVQCFGH